MRFRRLFSWQLRRNHQPFTGIESGPVAEPRHFDTVPLQSPKVATGTPTLPEPPGSTLFFRLRALTTHSQRVSY